jgi:adenylate cyclase
MRAGAMMDGRAMPMANPDSGPVTVRRISAVGNLIGAVLAFCYFRFIDYAAADLPRVALVDIAYSVLAFGLILLVGFWWGNRWTRPLGEWSSQQVMPAPTVDLVRRRALLLPYAIAMLTFVGWIMAGVLWGIVFPLLAGTFSPYRAIRQVFGTTVIAGSVTTAFVFFALEHQWRRRLPAFFPEGNLSAVPGVPRLPVRVRLLAIFLLIGVLPLTLLSVLSYTRALALLGADPATAGQIVDGMRVIILFILAVGVAAAVGLSVFAADSVAAPLSRLESAMGEVGRGNLDSRCPVVANDEIGAVAEGFNRMLQGLKERELVKETFGKYVTPEVRDEILAGRISGEGELKEVTILFADLRDFTPWVEATEPRQVVRDLNQYFTEMDRAIRAHDGLVLQFIGDEIEAVFGAPLPHPDHAVLAVRAAVEMRQRLRQWNARPERAGKPPLRHGIGIHTGTVLAGNIGSAERLSYALVGDPVNLASRIQGLTKDFGADILISDATRRRVDAAFQVEELPAVKVKGRSVDVNVYKVI